MSIIQTILGPIDPSELGITYSHDHILFIPPAPFDADNPEFRLDDIGIMTQEINYFKQAGGKCIVEMTTVEMGRSPSGLEAISKATGIHIIAATGFNKNIYCESIVTTQSIDRLVSDMVKDLQQGMDGTSLKAGLIKASSSLNQITPGELKVFQAVIQAHLATGAPISTHTEAGTMALEQIELMINGGVDPSHIIIGHLDRKLDWDYLYTIARTGVFMSFDQVSKEKYYPDALRISCIKKLFEVGHGGQLMLSSDIARKTYIPSYGFGYGPGYTYILWRFVPWMLESGIPKQAVEDILIHNPARAFAWVS